MLPANCHRTDGRYVLFGAKVQWLDKGTGKLTAVPGSEPVIEGAGAITTFFPECDWREALPWTPPQAAQPQDAASMMSTLMAQVAVLQAPGRTP